MIQITKPHYRGHLRTLSLVVGLLKSNQQVMKKIIVPLDFSATSLNAFTYALHLAKKIRAEIITVHIHEIEINSTVEFYDFLWANYEISELSEFENYKSNVPKLREIAEKFQLSDIQISHILEQGIAADAITALAKKEKADYIVMGTNGASGVKELFLGSLTEKIINNAFTPVLAIPPHGVYNKIRKILFLTKFDAADKPILDKAVKFASLFKAPVEVLQLGADRHDFEQPILKDWKKKYLQQAVNFNILDTNDVEKSVLGFIKLNHIDLAIMSAHHKNLFERLFVFSLASKMAFHSTVPVLAFPQQ
jgi:nucleotide-binding universal stress UspA family protein